MAVSNILQIAIKIKHLRIAQFVSLLFVPFAERNGHKNGTIYVL